MSATTVAQPMRATDDVPVESGHKDALKAKHAHAGIAMAAATFAMAAASGIQAVLYLSSFGVDGRTDGFFVAFALYATFGVFSQSIRVTSAPMLVGDKPRMTSRELGLALVFIAVPVAIVTIPLAGPFAHLLAPGLDADARSVTTEALPVLGGAMIFQLWAAGAATLLAVRDRFDRVAGAYIVGAAAGLIVYVAVAGSAGELSLGWSMLAMAIVTCALMLDGVRTSQGAPVPTRQLSVSRLVSSVGLVLGRTFVYLIFNALYLVTVAFASGYDAGDATVLSYAYLFASYLVAGTGFAMGMARIADMRRGALADWREVIADTVPGGFRYAIMICAPALGALVAGGAPLIGEVFPSSFNPDQVSQLQVFGALLAAWTVGALLVNLLLPAMFALDRARLVNLLAPAVMVLHLAATAVGGAVWGADGVVGGAFVAPLSFAVVLLVVGAGTGSGPLARELGRDLLRFAGLAAVSFGAGAAVGTLASGLVGSFIAVAVGSVLYVVLMSRLARDQVQTLVGSVKPASASASA
jgi:peptidoglycan biosynthesis protein MviN/MurJ (putative lipid II flippase)